MTEKAEALLQTPISHTPFPTSAPYARDQLAFAHNFIDEMLKWQKLCAKELQQLKQTDPYKHNSFCKKLVDNILGENQPALQESHERLERWREN